MKDLKPPEAEFVRAARRAHGNVLGLTHRPSEALARLAKIWEHNHNVTIITPYASPAGRSPVELSIDFLDAGVSPQGVDLDKVLVLDPSKIEGLWFRELYAPASMTGADFILAGEGPVGREEFETSALNIAAGSGDFQILWDPVTAVIN